NGAIAPAMAVGGTRLGGGGIRAFLCRIGLVAARAAMDTACHRSDACRHSPLLGPLRFFGLDDPAQPYSLLFPVCEKSIIPATCVGRTGSGISGCAGKSHGRSTSL